MVSVKGHIEGMSIQQILTIYLIFEGDGCKSVMISSECNSSRLVFNEKFGRLSTVPHSLGCFVMTSLCMSLQILVHSPRVCTLVLASLLM